MSTSIDNSTHLPTRTGNEKVPVGNGSGLPKHVTLNDIITDAAAGVPPPDLTPYALKATTVNGHNLGSNVTVTKGDVGLGSVDNTADTAKPVSTAQQTALDLKADKATTVNGHALSANVTVTASDVGLGSVENAAASTLYVPKALAGISYDGGISAGDRMLSWRSNVAKVIAPVDLFYGLINQVSTTENTPTSTYKIPYARIGLGDTGVITIANLFAGYIDNDTTLAGDSTTKAASQHAVKTYTDALIDAANAAVYKGVIDCSANPNYPAANAGYLYLVSVAGKLGGASGAVVEQGDMAICFVDSTASGNQATVGSSWNIIQKNLDGAVIGPASVTDQRIAIFSGTTGKLLADGGYTIAGLPVSTAQQTAIDAKVIDSIADADTTHAPSRNAVFDALALKADTTAVAAGYQPLDTQLTSLAGLAYTGNATKVIQVNAGETGFELVTPAGGGGATDLDGLTDAIADDTKSNLFLSSTSGNGSVTGPNNTAVGFDSGSTLGTGGGNTLVGSLAGNPITTGANNTAIGFQSMGGDGTPITGGNNTAVGQATLQAITDGWDNVAIGSGAGISMASAVGNVVIGKDAGAAFVNQSDNVAIGHGAMQTADVSASVAVGSMCLGSVSY